MRGISPGLGDQGCNHGSDHGAFKYYKCATMCRAPTVARPSPEATNVREVRNTQFRQAITAHNPTTFDLCGFDSSEPPFINDGVFVSPPLVQRR